jgi:CRISPR-associated protein Cst2
MARHFFGNVLTGYGTAANNRGENEGNITTLQKILWYGDSHTTVSAEAIRWAIRYYWQMNAPDENHELATNRYWDESVSPADNKWRDENWIGWKTPEGRKFIDDDVLGFMRTEGAKEEGSDESTEGKGKRKPTPKGGVNNRRGMLELTRAVSTIPYGGDITFNAKSGLKSNTSLYGTEVHATRYQYGFALTPERLQKPERALQVLTAICNLGEVAGNHGRFLYDFSPESMVLRWTHDFAPRLLYCFETPDPQTISAPALLQRVKSGDIDSKELVIAGSISATETGAELKALGAEVHAGIKAASEAMLGRMRGELA